MLLRVEPRGFFSPLILLSSQVLPLFALSSSVSVTSHEQAPVLHAFHSLN